MRPSYQSYGVDGLNEDECYTVGVRSEKPREMLLEGRSRPFVICPRKIESEANTHYVGLVFIHSPERSSRLRVLASRSAARTAASSTIPAISAPLSPSV